MMRQIGAVLEGMWLVSSIIIDAFFGTHTMPVVFGTVFVSELIMLG